MTPTDVDKCSFRDLNAMFVGVANKEKREMEMTMALEKEAWRRSLILTQVVWNAQLKKPKAFDYLAKKMLNEKGSKSGGITRKEFEKQNRKLDKRIAARLKREEKKRGNSS